MVFLLFFFYAASRQPARTIVQAQQVRLELQVKVSEQLFQRRSGSQAKPRSFQAAGLFLPNNCSRRTAAQPGRKIPAAVPGEPAAVPNNCTIPLLVKPDPDPDSQGIYLPETEQFPRLRPDPAPITPIPLRSEQFFGHRSHTLCK